MSEGQRITVRGLPFLWATEKGSWHFLRVTDEAEAEIRLRSLGMPGRFGSVPVNARVNGEEWRTSLFPTSRGGGYLLPLKALIRRKAGIEPGREVRVELELIF